jgi:hypothetical protein
VRSASGSARFGISEWTKRCASGEWRRQEPEPERVRLRRGLE